jgi:hypothetical protein
VGTGIIKAEVELRKNASILAFMEMRRDSEGYNTSKRADTHPNNPETWARRLTNCSSGRIFDFTWSPDGKQLLLIRGDLNGDVVLLSNFR